MSSSRTVKAIKSREEYSVGWLAALPEERAAATAMLDELHNEPSDFSQNATDANSYTWGRMGKHNVVIASLAAGVFGTTSAATTASGMLSSLPNIKFGLLVGIGAGVPNDWQDVRLGDIVVSQPRGNNGGVVQYDLGRANPEGTWERADYLSRPPEVLLKALAKLQSHHELDSSRVVEFINEAATRLPKFRSSYKHPGSHHDRLFKSVYGHVRGQNCGQCDPAHEIHRPSRNSTEPEIHYGVIASGNTLVNDGASRERRIMETDRHIICFEMEAAGLMNSFPCLVIRGISDYADSHKNYLWHRYASATAAAFAKEFLTYVDNADVRQAQKARDVLSEIRFDVENINLVMNQAQQKEQERKVNNFLRALYTCPYAERKDRNSKRIEGTCNWVTSHPRYRYWREEGSLLWISADPGCGKSVLARYLIDEVLTDPSSILCYFFFKDDFLDQRTSAQALCALIHQIYNTDRSLLSDSALEKYAIRGDKVLLSFSGLWDILETIASCRDRKEIICVIDGLDECDTTDRVPLIRAVTGQNFHKIKFLLTSRPYDDIRRAFQSMKRSLPTIHLQGEDELEVEKIACEINLVIRHQVQQIGQEKLLDSEECELLTEQLTIVPNRTYLWVYLTLEIIRETPGFTRGNVRRIITQIPKTVNEAYERILKRSYDRDKAYKLLSILIAAVRPLSLTEMSFVFAFNKTHNTYEDVQEEQEPDLRFRHTARDLCGLFIVIIGSKFYLLHQTAKDFLVQRSSSQSGHSNTLNLFPGTESSGWIHTISLLRSNRIVNLACIWYLNIYSTEGCPASFLDYSANHWPTHFRDSDVQSEDDSLVASACRLCDPSSRAYQIWYQHCWAGQLQSPQASSPLVIASYLGLNTVVKYLLQKNVSLEAKDKKSGQTSLSLAAREGHLPMVKLLIENGAEIDSKDEANTLTPLSHAVRRHVQTYPTMAHGHLEIAKLLLKKGADPNSRADTGMTILESCVGNNDIAMARLLLDHGAKIYDPEQDLDVVGSYSLSECGPDMGWFAPMWEKTPENRECKRSGIMTSAVENGNIAMVALLLEKGADVNYLGSNGDSLLRLAAVKGNLSMVEYLLHCGADIDSKGDTEVTPLLAAITHGHKEVTDFLMENGARVETTRNSFGQTPLFQAASGGLTIMIERLIQLGVEVNAVDQGGGTALHSAIEYGKSTAAAIKVLLDNGADPDQADNKGNTPLFLAGEKQDTQTMAYLLDRSSKSNDQLSSHTNLVQMLSRSRFQAAELLLTRQMSLEAKDRDGRSPLSYFASLIQNNVPQILTWLLKHGADINSKDKDGRTPVWWAAILLNPSRLEQLVKNGANIEEIDNYGDTQLCWALDNKDFRLVNFLLDNGAIFDGVSLRTKRPLLCIVAEIGNIKLLQELLQKGEDVNSEDIPSNQTALSLAASCGNYAAAELLLTKGAKVDSRASDGRTALSYTAENNDTELLKLLLDNGADVNAVDSTGRTPLSWAASGKLGSWDGVTQLIAKGADLEASDENGYTPLFWAVMNETPMKGVAVIQELVAKGANMESKDNEGRTPLSVAAECSDLIVMVRLLFLGADTQTSDNYGKTPGMWAMEGLEAKDDLGRRVINGWKDIKTGFGRREIACYRSGIHLFTELYVRKKLQRPEKKST